MSNWLRIEGRPDEPLIPEVGPFYERGYSGNCLPASVKRSFRLTEDLGKMGTSNTRFLRLAHKDTGATYLLRKIFTYTDQYPMMVSTCLRLLGLSVRDEKLTSALFRYNHPVSRCPRSTIRKDRTHL